MSLSLIAALSENNCIGKQNALPWYLPEDLKHFKTITTDKIVLMGRKTWESLPEKFRPLPNRTNIIITRQTDFSVPESVHVFASIDEATTAFRRMRALLGERPDLAPLARVLGEADMEA